MRIASDKTFEEFDRLKDQLFAHKRKLTPKQPSPKNPISAKFRWILPLLLIGGGAWLAYRNAPNLKDLLLQKQYITYQQSLAWSTLETYLRCRWKQAMGDNWPLRDRLLANRLYITRLESDLVYLKEKAPEKKLQIQTKSKFSLWVLGWRNEERIRYINQYGDLLERNRSSSLMVGDLLRIWTKSEDTLLQRERIFQFYEREMEEVGRQCERVNWLTKAELPAEKYAEVLRECEAESAKVRGRLQKFVEERLARERRQKVVYRQ